MDASGFDPTHLLRADRLAWVMAGLILIVVTNVLAYSKRYLAGDRHQNAHRRHVALLAASVLAMAFADHLGVLLVAWAAANLLLVRLMMHHGRWQAARNSGWLALKTFALGVTFLAAGFGLLIASSGTASISSLTQGSGQSSALRTAGLALVALAAMTQSAAWPFHRWLTSSLNSPTPVSALMHAGIVNGGGFLIVRFAPLFASEPLLLHGLYLAGLVTAVVGSFWKIVQTDVKRMLACSTMGQMGFMLMQCGMGLFAPAVSHLCWHGLFKAYLFLGAGSAVQEKRSRPAVLQPSAMQILLACFAGVCGALVFALSTEWGLGIADTRGLMIALAFMAATQLAAGVLAKPHGALGLAGVCLLGAGAGGLYGLSVRAMESLLPALQAAPPQPLDAVYLAGFAVIFLIWAGMLVGLPGRLQSMAAWKQLYVAALNASQPHPQTVTAIRSSYQS